MLSDITAITPRIAYLFLPHEDRNSSWCRKFVNSTNAGLNWFVVDPFLPFHCTHLINLLIVTCPEMSTALSRFPTCYLTPYPTFHLWHHDFMNHYISVPIQDYIAIFCRTCRVRVKLFVIYSRAFVITFGSVDPFSTTVVPT